VFFWRWRDGVVNPHEPGVIGDGLVIAATRFSAALQPSEAAGLPSALGIGGPAALAVSSRLFPPSCGLAPQRLLATIAAFCRWATEVKPQRHLRQQPRNEDEPRRPAFSRRAKGNAAKALI
jgi:hypothetical protein